MGILYLLVVEILVVKVTVVVIAIIMVGLVKLQCIWMLQVVPGSSTTGEHCQEVTKPLTSFIDDTFDSRDWLVIAGGRMMSSSCNQAGKEKAILFGGCDTREAQSREVDLVTGG